MALQFNGDPFSVSIEIWLPRSFPFQAPLVFIVPTAGQKLRPSPLVDPAGRIVHSYLQYWHTRPASSLIEMMNHLHPAFCQEPPIFLAPRQQQAPPPHVPSTAARAPPPNAPEPPKPSVGEMKTILKARLVTRYGKLQQELTGETDRILAESSALSEGEQKVKKALGNLRAELLRVKEEIEHTRARAESLQEQIGQLKLAGSFDVDRLIIPQGPVSKQIINELVAELALQDCIYAVSKAFEKGHLELNTYLRVVRDQAKKEFMAKATLLKIRELYPQ